jgi:predicted metalloprotease with PDZ domain
MRVYWSGAWYFLAADLQLRQRSKGRQSLDSALDQLNRCCADESLSVLQIVAKLDAITQTSIFNSLFRKMRESTEAPPHLPLYKTVGIAIKGPVVKLAGTAEQRALRAAITAPKSL